MKRSKRSHSGSHRASGAPDQADEPMLSPRSSPEQVSAPPQAIRTIRVVVAHIDDLSWRQTKMVKIDAGITTFSDMAAGLQRNFVKNYSAFHSVAPHIAGFFSLDGEATDKATLSARAKRDYLQPLSKTITPDTTSLLALLVVPRVGDPNLQGCSPMEPRVFKRVQAFLDASEDDEFIPSPTSKSPDSKIMIREVYEDLANIVDMKKRLKSIVITGMPGVGKTIFLWFLLRRYRNKCCRVVFDCEGLFLLAEPNGAVLSGKRGISFDHHLADPETVYLCDAVPRCEPLSGCAIKATTIVTISPTPSIVAQYVKNASTLYYFMPPWSLEELKKCVKKYVKADSAAEQADEPMGEVEVEEMQMREVHATAVAETYSVDTVESLFACYGGSARHTLVPDEDLEAKLEQFHDTLKALRGEDFSTNFEFIGKTGVIDTKENKICHCLVHLHPAVDSSGAYRYDKVTLTPASRLACFLMIKGSENAVDSTIMTFLVVTSRAPQFAPTRGIIFEGWAHKKLKAGGTYEVRDLETKVKGNCTISSTEVIDFATLDDDIQHGVYAAPKARNFPAVDAIVRPRRLFQMTVSDHHPIIHHHLQHLMEKLTIKEHPDRFSGANKPTFNDLEEMKFELYFVVPDEKFDAFARQTFLTKRRQVFRSPTVPITQYALKINLAVTPPSQE